MLLGDHRVGGLVCLNCTRTVKKLGFPLSSPCTSRLGARTRGPHPCLAWAAPGTSSPSAPDPGGEGGCVQTGWGPGAAQGQPWQPPILAAWSFLTPWKAERPLPGITGLCDQIRQYYYMSVFTAPTSRQLTGPEGQQRARCRSSPSTSALPGRWDRRLVETASRQASNTSPRNDPVSPGPLALAQPGSARPRGHTRDLTVARAPEGVIAGSRGSAGPSSGAEPPSPMGEVPFSAPRSYFRLPLTHDTGAAAQSRWRPSRPDGIYTTTHTVAKAESQPLVLIRRQV